MPPPLLPLPRTSSFGVFVPGAVDVPGALGRGNSINRRTSKKGDRRQDSGCSHAHIRRGGRARPVPDAHEEPQTMRLACTFSLFCVLVLSVASCDNKSETTPAATGGTTALGAQGTAGG